MQIYQVDAFSREPFRGNPAAVCLLDAPRPDVWLQAVAAEMNLAETAFVERAASGPPGGFGLRWFTPAVEVDLCGHATLATAHILWECGEVAPTLEFLTRSGLLTATRTGDGIQLDFPADPPRGIPAPPGLAAALGADPVAVGRGRSFYLAELADAATVRSLAPAIAAIAALDAGRVIVTAVGDADADFVSRIFAPNFGIDEDPVTGAAHCCLGPYWQARLGRDRLVGYQASARGGFVGVAVQGDRVLLEGQAVTVFRGELLA
jgi:PhzF family phenazine biosynthesis protein